MPGKRLGLIAARKTAGLSQECLAEQMDVDRSTVQRWESGQSTPQPCHRPKLARVLGISDDKLAELLAVIFEFGRKQHWYTHGPYSDKGNPGRGRRTG